MKERNENGGKTLKKKIITLLLALVMIALFSVSTLATSIGSDSLTLNNTTIVLKPGDLTLLTASLNGIATTDVSWSVKDQSIATVSGGAVTGVTLGMTTVTATSSSGLSASCVVNVAYKGIDVSKYQQNINWSSVKSSGIDFAIIRAGFTGTDSLTPQIDPYFTANYSGATQNGIKAGVYYYSCATNTAKASEEANMCLNILNGRALDYPVIYDIENSNQRTMSSAALADVVITFCETVQTAGYKVAVYSSPSIFNSNLSSPSLDSLDRWVANWGVSVPNFSKPYTMWQYGYGTVPGITTGVVDLDYSYKDYSSNGQTPSTPTTPTDPSTPTDPTAPPAAITLLSDTTSTYSFGSNSTYTYKITTNSATAPTAASSNPSAVKVAYSQRTSGGYLYKITNMGPGTATITTTASDGSSVFFTAVGKTTSGVISDTTMPFTMKRNATYVFKLTPVGAAGIPKITTGNGSVLAVTTTQKINGSYYIKVSARAKGCTSVYTTITGQQPVRQCMITVV
jgi:GH25 family lysozyme M1 (1,4-beta-N-acetylmuramidase)